MENEKVSRKSLILFLDVGVYWSFFFLKSEGKVDLFCFVFFNMVSLVVVWRMKIMLKIMIIFVEMKSV